MRAKDIKDLLRQHPLEPIEIGLSDGRSVTVRHRDQVVVAERHLVVGLAHLKRSKPMSTPASGEAIAKDSLLVNLLQVVTTEPANGNHRSARRRPR
jgi:hypothetical protein